MLTFHDTHAHLDDAEFEGDLPQVLERASAAGVSRINTIGTDLDSSRRSLALAEQHAQVFAVVGWHPADAHLAPDDFRPVLRALAAHPKVVALGETGLDYHWLPSREHAAAGAAEDTAHRERQARLFQQHLEVAAELGLNVVIHQREAFEEALAILRPFAARVGAVFHCFGESPDQLRRLLELGCLVSFTGIVTYKNAQTVRDSVIAAPFGSFMLETDAPSLAPVPHRGRRCEPAHVIATAEAVAKIKACSLQELSTATCETADRFFARRHP